MRIVRASVAVEPRQPPLKTDSEGICHGVSSDRFPERSRVAPERRGRSLPPVRQFLSAPARLYAPNRYRHWRIPVGVRRSEEHTSELQSRGHLVCRLLLEKKNICIISFR